MTQKTVAKQKAKVNPKMKTQKAQALKTNMAISLSAFVVTCATLLACIFAFVGINFDSTKTLLNGGKVYYEKDINYLKDSALSGADTAYKDGYTEGVNSQAGAITDAHQNGYTEGVNSQTGAITDAHQNGYTEGVNSQKDKIDSAFADGNAAGIAQAKLINVGDYVDGFFYNVKEKFDFSTLDWSNPHIKIPDGYTDGTYEASQIILVSDFIPSTNFDENFDAINNSCVLLLASKAEDKTKHTTAYAIAEGKDLTKISYAGNIEMIERAYGYKCPSTSQENWYGMINAANGKKTHNSGAEVAYVHSQQDFWGKLISAKNSFRTKYTQTELNVGDQVVYANAEIKLAETQKFELSTDNEIYIAFDNLNINNGTYLTIQNIKGNTKNVANKGVFITATIINSNGLRDRKVIYSSESFNYFNATIPAGWANDKFVVDSLNADKINLTGLNTAFKDKAITDFYFNFVGVDKDVSNADMAIINKLLSSTPFPTTKA